MSVPSDARSQLMDEIRRGKLANSRKRFHSENSLQQFGEEDPETPEKTETDPGVLNEAVKATKNEEVESMERARRRAMSQPGPISGSLLTATAARAARKRTPRNVMYADPAKLESTERQIPRYLSPFDNDAANTSISERGSPLPYNGYRNFDSRSVGSYRFYASNNEPRGTATPRKRSVMTMDGVSIRSADTQAPPPTSPEVKKKRTTDSMALVFSCMYAILLVTLGLIIYVADSFIEINAAPIYNIILASIGFLYMFYLLIDIGRYKRIALKNQKIKSQHLDNIEEFFANQDSQEQSGNSTPRNQNSDNRPSPLRALPPPMLIPLSHDYCFSQGRHSGGFYLKLGAAGFALGHMVHSILLITVQIAYYMDDAISNDDCVDTVQMALDFMFPLYCFVQLYFVFKYSNVIILKAQGLARFAFMHFIGSSLCFWLSAIVRETILGLSLYAQTIYGNANTRDNDEGQSITKQYLIDISSLYNENCIGGARAINSIFENFSPYLYPFSVEFNILIVAVFYIIWSNIGNCDRDSDKDDDGTSSISDDNTICKIPTASEENDFSSNIVIHADCHASNRGLFAGLIVTVCTIGMLIIGFVFSSVDDGFLETGYILNYCTKLFLHVTMLIGSVVAYNQIRQLDVNEHSISLLDDVLLFICLPAYFIEATFSLVATISILNVVKTIDFIVMVLQVLIQTALICDALRRCSNSRKLRRKKPGREIIMFLLIVNVAMWLFHTFSYKSPESHDERYAFYGKVLWTILGHISLPLMMFYRFHSSVCFADIWDSAFKPGSEH